MWFVNLIEIIFENLFENLSIVNLPQTQFFMI